jgi:hypothetical protein
MVSGTCADDMAARLASQNIAVDHIDSDTAAALTYFLNDNPNQPKQIFATYTAMLEIREVLKKRHTKK